MKAIIQRKRRKDKRRIQRKLRREEQRVLHRLTEARELEDQGRPMMSSRRVRYELSDRKKAIAHGGVPAMSACPLFDGTGSKMFDGDGAPAFLFP